VRVSHARHRSRLDAKPLRGSGAARLERQPDCSAEHDRAASACCPLSVPARRARPHHGGPPAPGSRSPSSTRRRTISVQTGIARYRQHRRDDRDRHNGSHPAASWGTATSKPFARRHSATRPRRLRQRHRRCSTHHADRPPRTTRVPADDVTRRIDQRGAEAEHDPEKPCRLPPRSSSARTGPPGNGQHNDLAHAKPLAQDSAASTSHDEGIGVKAQRKPDRRCVMQRGVVEQSTGRRSRCRRAAPAAPMCRRSGEPRAARAGDQRKQQPASSAKNVAAECRTDRTPAAYAWSREDRHRTEGPRPTALPASAPNARRRAAECGERVPEFPLPCSIRARRRASLFLRYWAKQRSGQILTPLEATACVGSKCTRVSRAAGCAEVRSAEDFSIERARAIRSCTFHASCARRTVAIDQPAGIRAAFASLRARAGG